MWIISQRVAPRPSAASFWSDGTVAMTVIEAVPGRVVPIALVNWRDVDAAAKELTACLKAGFRGLFVPPETVDGRRPSDPHFDPIWRLCEEAGAMCIAGDTIGLEVLPSEEPDVFLPIHAYMFATAGAQIIEVVDMEEIAAEKQYEFAFLGMPLKLRGATGAPMPSYAVPLKS